MHNQELQKITELREEFIQKLNEVLQEGCHEDKDTGKIYIPGYSFEQLGTMIQRSKGQISRLFKDPKLDGEGAKEESYRNAINNVDTLITYKDNEFPKYLKEHAQKGLKKKLQLWYTIPSLVIGIVITIIIMQKYQSLSNGINTLEQFKAIFELAAEDNAKTLADLGMRENEENMLLAKSNGRDTLTKTERIKSIDHAKNRIRNTLEDNREKIRGLGLMVNGKRNIAEFADFIIHPDSLFKANSEDIDKFNFEDNNIPDRILQSPYDMALIEIKPYLLEPADCKDILNNISIISQKYRSRFQAYNIELFECYMKYGEPCFNKTNFNCYLESQQICH